MCLNHAHLTMSLKDSWNKLSVSLQWSNLYSAYSISPKLRSIGITDGYVKLDNDQITLLAEVEHNRWNMEKPAAWLP